MEVILSSETSVHIRATQRYSPEDGNITTAERTSNPTPRALLRVFNDSSSRDETDRLDCVTFNELQRDLKKSSLPQIRTLPQHMPAVTEKVHKNYK
jgi:hypothetical protein